MRIVDEEHLKNMQQENEETLVEENAELRTFRQKVAHFWEYEKWKIIIPLVLLIVANSFIQTY